MCLTVFLLGYCETGHEMFDDDLLEEEDYAGSSRRSKAKAKGKKANNKEERENQKANFLSVRDMLTNMPAKRKRETAETSTSGSTNDDELLGEMLQELREEKKPRTSIPSGLKLMEKTRAVEKMISAGKIHEEKPFEKKLVVKKKFNPFTVVNHNDRPEVKEEPVEIGDFDEDGFEPDMSASEVIEEFSSEKPFVEPEAKKAKVEPPSPKTNKVQLQEVEDFEMYRQAGAGEVPKGSDKAEDAAECMVMEESGTQKVKVILCLNCKYLLTR